MGRIRGISDLYEKIFPGAVVRKPRTTSYKSVMDFAKEKTKKIFKQTGHNIKNMITGKKGKMSTQEKKSFKDDHHAQLSMLAYEMDMGKKKSVARKLGYDVDDELTTANHTVYKHRQSGRGIVSYRGTDPSNADDLMADADIIQGKRDHKRFRDSLDVAKKAQKKYKELELSGHSLGGTQALHAYEALGVKTRVFNPGASIRGQQLRKHSSGVVPEIVRHENDIISSGWEEYATETYGDGNVLGDFMFGGFSDVRKNLLKAHSINDY